MKRFLSLCVAIILTACTSPSRAPVPTLTPTRLVVTTDINPYADSGPDQHTYADSYANPRSHTPGPD